MTPATPPPPPPSALEGQNSLQTEGDAKYDGCFVPAGKLQNKQAYVCSINRSTYNLVLLQNSFFFLFLFVVPAYGHVSLDL